MAYYVRVCVGNIRGYGEWMMSTPPCVVPSSEWHFIVPLACSWQLNYRQCHTAMNLWLALLIMSFLIFDNHTSAGWHEIDDSIPRFQGKLDRIAKLFQEVQIYQTNCRLPRGTESKSFRLRRSPQLHRKRASSWHVPTGKREFSVQFSLNYLK